MLYSFSNTVTQSAINFLMFVPLRRLAKILASAYDFAVNIVMWINITINKTNNIHVTVLKIIYAARTYVNITMVIKPFYDLLMNYSCY